MKILALILTLFSFNVAVADDTRTGDKRKIGLVYGKGLAFKITEPDGWNMSYIAGNSFGYPLVFYPSDSSWQDANSVIYLKIRNNPTDVTGASAVVDILTTDDEKAFKDLSPKLEVESAPTILTAKGGNAIIRKYSDGDKLFYATAYIPLDKYTPSIIFSTRNKDAFEKDYVKFEQAVKSYKFETAKVDDKTLERLNKRSD